MEADAQASGALPPLRPAAHAKAGGAPHDDVEANLAPAREIEEHEVEMYREQDVCPKSQRALQRGRTRD